MFRSSFNVLLLLLLLAVERMLAFQVLVGAPFRSSFKFLAATKSPPEASPSSSAPKSIADVLVGVVAPLKRIGPYPCVGLHFPDWNQEGAETEYDFLLDTGANVNSIQSKLVERFHLPVFHPDTDGAENPVAAAAKGPLPLIGVTGGRNNKKADKHKPTRESTSPVSMHLLGDCQLVGLPPPKLTFLRNLVGTSLPFASPVGEGLLGLPLFWTFPAGIEFDWHGTDGDPPTLVFYFGEELPDEMANTDRMVKVPIQVMLGGLLTVKIRINDGPEEIPALLDTGSPITVINEEAASRLGIQVALPVADFRYSEVPSVGIIGADGGTMKLDRSESPVSIEILGASSKGGGDDPREGFISFFSLGQGYVWKGDLPGLELISTLSQTESVMGLVARQPTPLAPVPAVILGLDFLQNAYRMIVRAPKSELWLEELPKDLERKYC